MLQVQIKGVQPELQQIDGFGHQVNEGCISGAQNPVDHLGVAHVGIGGMNRRADIRICLLYTSTLPTNSLV